MHKFCEQLKVMDSDDTVHSAVQIKLFILSIKLTFLQLLTSPAWIAESNAEVVKLVTFFRYCSKSRWSGWRRIQIVKNGRYLAFKIKTGLHFAFFVVEDWGIKLGLTFLPLHGLCLCGLYYKTNEIVLMHCWPLSSGNEVKAACIFLHFVSN